MTISSASKPGAEFSDEDNLVLADDVCRGS